MTANFRRAAAGLLTVLFLACCMHGAHAAPVTGWWWNPSESGRGFTIEVQGSTLFMAGYLYDASGRASWVVSVGPMASATHYSGTLLMFGSGQTLTGAFKSNVALPSPGNITIDFPSNRTGTLTWPGGTIPIQRFDIAANGSSTDQPVTNPQVGWWWNAAESGRGFAIEVQNNTMFLAGYMYDSTGNPIWYASGPTLMSSTTLYQGNWAQFAGGQTLTGTYKAPTVANPNVGPISIQFNGPANATMTLPDGRQLAITRFAFGVSAPVLSAFNPAAAPPASLLTVSGTGFDASGEIALNLFDDSGYSVSIPPASATATAIKVSVPPYILPSTGAFGASSVKLSATQKSSGITLTTNTLSGFTIQQLPTVPGTAGASTLSLLRANLAEAQRLQSAIVGTAQNTAAVSAALAKQVSNLQTLVTSVQTVVQGGQSFVLGIVGGTQITVTSSNIRDVDSLILATMQSLASPTGGSSLKGAEVAGSSCLSSEALALYNGMLSGASNLDALAQALVRAPNNSAACGTADAFTLAYQIFGGAGGAGLGITNGAGAGTNLLRLPGAALFSTAAQNAEGSLGLNALLSPLLAAQLAAVQSAIANVASLARPTSDLLLARTSGLLATNLTDSQNFTGTIAPPPPTLPTGFPTNLPTGNYSLSFTLCVSAPGMADTCGADTTFATLTNADANLIASSLVDALNQACAQNGSSVSCSTSYTPFDGTKFQVNLSISGPGSSLVFTYTIRKTG